MAVLTETGKVSGFPKDREAVVGPVGITVAQLATDQAASTPTLIVEAKTFLLDSLRSCVRLAFPGEPILGFPNVQSAMADERARRAGLLILSLSGLSRDAQQQAVADFSTHNPGAPTVVFCEFEEPGRIVDLLSHGVRGCLFTSLSMEVAVQALRLVKAGGQFVPASCLVAAHRSDARSEPREDRNAGVELFTSRQYAVIEALRKGKANKTIAYELNMCESTVKVHVRNIMKKLRAKNRTEAAYLANDLLEKRNGAASERC